MEHDTAPNHHRDHAGFTGVRGALAAVRFLVGRGDDAATAVALAGVGPGDVLVDIGCGPGVAARRAASLGATVIGIDPAPAMLRMGRALARGVDYRLGAAEALPVDDGAATVVWSLSTVHHWPDLERGLAEVRRVLRPGGRFVVTEKLTVPGATGHAGHGWLPAQADAFAEQLGGAGFDEVTVGQHSARRTLLSVRGVAGPR